MKESGSKKIIPNQILDIRSIATSFINNMEDLRGFIWNLVPSAEEYDEKAKEILLGSNSILGNETQNLPEYSNSKRVDKNKVNEAIPKVMSHIKSRVATRYLNSNQTDILYRVSFVMLIGYFEYLLADMFRYNYLTFPDALLNKALCITLDDLNTCSDKREAIDHILDKKVKSELAGKLDDQLKVFSRLKLGHNKIMVQLDLIREAMERRNLIVHKNGIVDKKYINNIKKLTKNIKEGDVLSIDSKYFNNIYEELFFAGIGLIQNCWRKCNKREIDDADAILGNEISKAIQLEDHSLANRLCQYAKSVSLGNEVDMQTIEIYYCHTLKRLGKKDEMEAELKKLRQKELTPLSLVMVCALVDDKDGFYKRVEDVARLGAYSKSSFILNFDWPTLVDMRNDEDYIDRIEKAFAKVEVK